MRYSPERKRGTVKEDPGPPVYGRYRRRGNELRVTIGEVDARSVEIRVVRRCGPDPALTWVHRTQVGLDRQISADDVAELCRALMNFLELDNMERLGAYW